MRQFVAAGDYISASLLINNHHGTHCCVLLSAIQAESVAVLAQSTPFGAHQTHIVYMPGTLNHVLDQGM